MIILIIGLGSIAQKHLFAIRKIMDNPIIYALRSETNANVISGVQNIFSLNQLELKPDFVIISNPTYLHAESIKQAVELDCPLFIEKPVLHNLIDIELIKNILAKHSTVTYVACNLRFHPVIQYLRDFVYKNDEVINEVNIYCGSYLPEWRPNRNYRNIYSANQNMGGGVHLDLVHELDYCCWLFGLPQKSFSLKRNVSSLHIDAIDYAQFNLLYDKFTANIVLNYFRKDQRRDIEIVTEKGTIKADLTSCIVRSLTLDNILFHQEFTMADSYISQMKYFYEHIKDKKKPMNDFIEATEIVKIALS